MTAPDMLAVLEEAKAAYARVRLLPALPEAYLRDRIHLDLLAEVSRSLGRDPFPSLVDGTLDRLTGVPIFIDPDVPEGMLELRWPDGRRQQIRFSTDPTPSPDLLATTVAECLPPDPQWLEDPEAGS